MKTGIIYDMPEAEYHAIDAISSTTLKALESSTPAHVKAREYAEATECMELGSAAHCMVLQPEKFAERYYRRPIAKGNTKAGKALIAQASQDNEGKTAIRAKDWRNLELIRGVVSAHPVAAPLLAESKKEVSIFWEEGFGPCKARFDLLAGSIIGDLKTAASAHPRSFVRDVLYGRSFPGGKRMGPYWVQAAWYFTAACAVGLEVSEFVFIAIELDAPFGISIHSMERAELLALGAKTLVLAERWAECLKTGVYPCYPFVKNIVTCGEEEA